MEKIDKENKENNSVSKVTFKKMASSKANVALNMNAMNTIVEVPTKLPPDPDSPSVEDFEHYLPFACAQMQIYYPVVVTRVVMQEYVAVSSKLGKAGIKSRMKMQLMSPTKVSNITHSASAHTKPDDSETYTYVPEVTIDLDAVYSGNDLVQINFHKDTYINADVLRVIGLIISFYPYLNRITINSRTYEYVLYELSKFLPMSNLTEIILDGCRLLCSQYEVLLEDPGKLSHLSLARCRIDDPILKKICEQLSFPLPASKTLSLLNLSSNRISDVGAVYIATFLRSNRRLKYLNLNGNWLTDVGCQSILNILKEFPLTFEEDQAAGARYLEYVTKKTSMTVALIKELKSQSPKPIKIKHANDTKEVKHAPDNKENKAKKGKSVGTKRSSTNDIADDYKLAFNMASVSLGNFDDPFGRQDIFTKQEILFSYGNNTLCYLNLSYNQLTTDSINLVLDVLNIQSNLNRKPIGLLKICLEGNLLPERCDELAKIDHILDTRIAAQIDSTSKKRSNLHRRSSRDLIL